MTMALLVEKEVRAYQTKANTTICPVCASDEEKAKETLLVAEDVIHDPAPMYCVRCKKKIK